MVKIPQSVINIDNGAMAGCTRLNKIIFKNSSNLETVGKNAVKNTGKTLTVKGLNGKSHKDERAAIKGQNPGASFVK